MITELSLNDHRARSHHLITLIVVLLLSTVPVCAAFGQDQSALTSPVDTAVSPASKSTDDARPSLEELMATFAKHEAAYTPFHIQVRETYPAPAGGGRKELNLLLFGDEREREMVFQYAQRSSSDWMSQQSTIVEGAVENMIRAVHTKEGTVRRSDVNEAPVEEATGSSSLLNATPLIGLFPLRMRSSSNPVLLSEYYKEDPSRLKLSWDGPLAKLTFEFAGPDDRPTRMKLWLDPAFQWHPVKLQGFHSVPDQLFDDEWKVTEFRIAEKDVRVSAGTWRSSQVDWNDKHAIDTAEKFRTMNFVVTGSCYGDRVNPAVFSPETAIDTSRLRSSEPAEGTVVPVKNITADSSTPSQQVTVYHLRFAKAEQARQLIRELYPVEFEILVADARTNALYFRGSEASTKALDELLEVLDSDSSLKPVAPDVKDGVSPFEGGGSGGTGASPFGAAGGRPKTTEPNRPAPNSSASPNEGDRVVRLFHLKRIDPDGAIRTIDDLTKGNVDVESIVDSENNLHALVLRGDANAVKQVEAVLRKLDEVGTKGIEEAQSFDRNEQSPSAPLATDRSVAEDTTGLRREYERCESLSKEVARKLHELQTPIEDESPLEKQVREKAVTDHRNALRDAVRQSFEARQKLQRAELAEFARRMKNLQQSLDTRDRIAEKIVERRMKELQDPTLNWDATESAHEAKSSAKAIIRIGSNVSKKIEDGATGEPERGLRTAVENASDDTRQQPTSDAEIAVARLVMVFFQDQARRAVPALMIGRGTETFVLTTGPATIVPDGVPLAMDRAFLEFPGEAEVKAEFIDTRTADLRLFRTKPGLTKFQLEKPVALAIGDSLSAILPTGQPELRVTPKAAHITAFDQAKTFAIPTHTFRHEFSGLVQIDHCLPEGTPLFKDGQLAGIVLLGTRFLGDDARQSLVVPAERIFEVLGTMPE